MRKSQVLRPVSGTPIPFRGRQSLVPQLLVPRGWTVRLYQTPISILAGRILEQVERRASTIRCDADDVLGAFLAETLADGVAGQLLVLTEVYPGASLLPLG